MAFQDDKDEIITLIRAQDCKCAEYIDRKARSYSDLVDFVFAFSKFFDCDTAYLDALVAVVDDATRIANGVYVNKTDTFIANPRILVNCTYDEVLINDSTNDRLLMIASGSAVAALSVENATTLDLLCIQGASTVGVVGVDEDCCINVLYVRSCEDNHSTLEGITYGSCVRNMSVDQDATFGGFDCAPSVPLCLIEITSPVVSEESSTGFRIDWTNDPGSIGLVASYRRQGELAWNSVNPHLITSDSEHLTLDGLEPDTIYQVLIQSMCDLSVLSEGIIVTALTQPNLIA